MGKELANDLYTISEILETGIDQFEIKSYQRGYRWDINNVKTLIDDINGCPSGKIYCLQPLVVTKLSERKYEVIDGQQRLTTFKILLHCLKQIEKDLRIPDYEIFYETRSCSSFIKKLYDNELYIDLLKLDLETINTNWNTLKLEKEEVNRDNFHIYSSYCTCTFLLKNLSQEEITLIVEKIKEQIKFIWYEINLKELNTSAEKLFININKNKIRLTGADLIKALFILDIENDLNYNIEIKHLKKQTLANEWDEIEQALGDPDFWFFLTNTKEYFYDVRIGKIFDIITENKQESDLGSYFIMKEDKSLRNWNKVNQYFKISQEWFEDIYWYHRIGFLINMNILSYGDILYEYNRKSTISKNTFKVWLNKQISNYIEKVQINDINYRKNSGRYGFCTGILLLYNILLLEKYYPHQRFSFGDFVEQEWSIEHIQPQKPKERKASAWLAWLSEIESIISIRFLSKEASIIKVDKDQYGIEELDFSELKDSLINLEFNDKINKEILKNLEILQDIFEEEYPTHKIQNLALLDKVTNSRLSNGSFKEKRSLILQIQEGEENINNQKVYLPLGTIHVFSKTMITDKENVQLDYWGINDGERYLQEIITLLNPYLNGK